MFIGLQASRALDNRDWRGSAAKSQQVCAQRRAPDRCLRCAPIQFAQGLCTLAAAAILPQHLERSGVPNCLRRKQHSDNATRQPEGHFQLAAPLQEILQM